MGGRDHWYFRPWQVVPLRMYMRSYQRKGFSVRQMKQKAQKSIKMCFCLELSTRFFIYSYIPPIQTQYLLLFLSQSKYLLSVTSLSLQRSRYAYLFERIFFIPDCLIFWQSCLRTFLANERLLNLQRSQSHIQPSLFPSKQRKVMKRRCQRGITLSLLLIDQNSLMLRTSGNSKKSQILFGFSYLVFIHLQMLCLVRQRAFPWILSSKLPISFIIFNTASPSLCII